MSFTCELSSSLWNDGLQTTELSLPLSAFKSFNAQLAVGYPTYAMVIQILKMLIILAGLLHGHPPPPVLFILLIKVRCLI